MELAGCNNPALSTGAVMGHFYLKDGTPFYEVPNKTNGRIRGATVRDAKEVGAAPSVTTIIGMLDKPGLRNYFADQHIDATVDYLSLHEELMRVLADGVTLDDRKAIKRLAREHAKQAAEKGTIIHDAVESYFKTGRIPKVHAETVQAVIDLLDEKCGKQDWKAEEWFCSALGFGGKIDLISDGLGGSDGWVIDFKTKPGNASDHKMYKEQLMQLVAYDEGYGENANARKMANIIISRDIPGSVFWWEWTDTDAMIDAWYDFEALLGIWHREHKGYFFDEDDSDADLLDDADGLRDSAA